MLASCGITRFGVELFLSAVNHQPQQKTGRGPEQNHGLW
jgi:hypothetical protein